MASTFSQADVWKTRPLCRRYLHVRFEVLRAAVLSDDGAVKELAVVWAMGVLDGGECEVIGTWPAALIGPPFWREVFDELCDRGVEDVSILAIEAFTSVFAASPFTVAQAPACRMRGRKSPPFAVLHDPHFDDAMRAIYEAVDGVLTSAALRRWPALLGKGHRRAADIGGISTFKALAPIRPPRALSTRRPRLVRCADEFAEQLSRTLSRAIGRHGSFSDPDAATSFIAQTLMRAESRLAFQPQSIRPQGVTRAPASRHLAGDIRVAEAT